MLPQLTQRFFLVIIVLLYAIINILTKIINLIKTQNNFKKKLKIFGDIKNKTIFVPQ
jgi:hypothetical protein